MAVNGQATDKGMSGMTSRDKGNFRYPGDFVEGEARAKRKMRPEMAKAINGHALSSGGHPAKSIADSRGGQGSAKPRRSNQAGAHGPNVQFQGQVMPHGDVQSAPGKVLGKTNRQGRNTYGPNIQFQGADHQHDPVKTSGS
jgi:hypothetical protein